jgi:DNA-binding GntR family transcriptional regulator
MNNLRYQAELAAPLYADAGGPVPVPADLTELRLLIEVGALRRLADRGLSDQERAACRTRAHATVLAARDHDPPCYSQAAEQFHQYLLDMSGDHAAARLGWTLNAIAPPCGPVSEQDAQRLLAPALEHWQLLDLLADDRVSVACELLRRHLRYGASPVGRRTTGARDAGAG